MVNHPVKYIVIVEGFKESLFATVSKLKHDYPEYSTVRFLLLTTQNPDKFPIHSDLVVVRTDFHEDHLEHDLAPYFESIIAVLCRGDKYVQYLRRLVPMLPSWVRVAPSEALEIATNKRLMRQYFNTHHPEISPAFVTVADGGSEVIDAIEKNVGYPAIIKPASLASSILIQKIHNRTELRRILSETLEKITQVYRDEGRNETPEVIVEEFMTGDFYSIDSYVMGIGETYHMPVVGYLPAESMGIDDFFLYKRWLPVNLTEVEIAAARLVVEKAVNAVGLEWSSAHTELIKTAKGWRVIEIGPRIGRFRNMMYQVANGIDHEYNDLLIHLGKRPDIIPHRKAYSVAYSIYPHLEGTLQGVMGLDLLDNKYQNNVMYKMIDVERIKRGQPARFAKNGGHALAEVVFRADTADEVADLSSDFESSVHVSIEEGDV